MIRLISRHALDELHETIARLQTEVGQQTYARSMAQTTSGRWESAVAQGCRLIADMMSHMNKTAAYLTNDVQYGASEHGHKEVLRLFTRGERYLDINRIGSQVVDVDTTPQA